LWECGTNKALEYDNERPATSPPVENNSYHYSFS
jgi:hypothetical protein